MRNVPAEDATQVTCLSVRKTKELEGEEGQEQEEPLAVCYFVS